MEGWKIQRDRTACEQPGCPLRTRADYYAVLELPSCVRRDLCERCFREEMRGREEPPLFWRGRRRAAENKQPTLDLESLRQLFDRLGEASGAEEQEAAQGLRYLVALLLLRKRKLRMVPARTPEQERADLVVLDPKAENAEPVALTAPEITSERFAALKDELLAALGADVPAS